MGTDYISLKYLVDITKGKKPKYEIYEYNEGLIPYLSMDYLRGKNLSPIYVDETKDSIVKVNNDDLLILWDGSKAGEIIYGKEGALSSTMAKIEIKSPKVRKSYLTYFLIHSQPDIQGNTVGMGIPHVNGEDLKNLSVYLPSKETQIRIAEFLDKKTAEIDTIIQKKENLLLLLEEKKKAIINEAVTKGLNPNAPMKDSGIEWIGEIPEHWKLTQLKYLTEKVGSGVTPRGGAEVYTEEGVKFIRSQNVYFDGLRLDDVVFIDEKTHLQMENSKVVFNDVLLNITGGSIGRSCVVEMNEEFNVNQHVCIIRPSDELNSEYLNFFLYSNIGQTQIRLGITGGNREGLNFENLKSFIIPKLDIIEQELIVNTIKLKVVELNSIESKILAQIDKLKEYRQSLISEAVTGKIDI